MSTRVHLLCLLLSIACLACLAGQRRQVRLTEKYQDKDRGYIVHYPGDYEMQKGLDDSTRVFASPEDDELDIFRENFAVLVRSYDRDVSLGEARTALRKEMESQGGKLTEESEKVKLSGRAAHRYTWTMRLGGFDLELVQLVTTVKDRVYVVAYTYENGKQRRHSATAEAMADAFEITYK